MDSGIALVLGAVIALTGSALIPWAREALTARRVSRERNADRLYDAIVELLAVNAEMAVALISTKSDALGAVYSERQRASTRLLLAVPKPDRESISDLLGDALPTPDGEGKVRHNTLVSTHALQNVLVQ